MKMFNYVAILVTTVFLSCVTVPPGNPTDGYTIHGYIGETAQMPSAGTSVLLINGEDGQVIAIDQSDLFGKYTFPNVKPGHYQLKVNSLVMDFMVTSENLRLDVNLSNAAGTMDYAAEGKKELIEQAAAAAASAASGRPAPVGPNDPQLASQIAGIWWGYSGSTESKMALCPDGSFSDFSESSYSGTMSDGGGNQTGAWGNANQSGSQGTWTVQGNMSAGTIMVSYNSGNSNTIRYEASDDGCMWFDGTKLCQQSSTCD
jgi:hypothetical protein